MTCISKDHFRMQEVMARGGKVLLISDSDGIAAVSRSGPAISAQDQRFHHAVAVCRSGAAAGLHAALAKARTWINPEIREERTVVNFILTMERAPRPREARSEINFDPPIRDQGTVRCPEWKQNSE